MPAAHHALAVDRAEADPHSLLHAFRRFLAWRRGQPALLHGTLEPLDLPAPLVGFIRRHEARQILAVFNLADDSRVLDCSRWAGMRVLAESGFRQPAARNEMLPLGPYGVVFAELTAAHIRNTPLPVVCVSNSLYASSAWSSFQRMGEQLHRRRSCGRR